MKFALLGWKQSEGRNVLDLLVFLDDRCVNRLDIYDSSFMDLDASGRDGRQRVSTWVRVPLFNMHRECVRFIRHRDCTDYY